MSQDAGTETGVVNVPNALSVLRLVLVPVFAALILGHRPGWAVIVLIVSGITDYLDGYLARRWGQVSRLGQLLDPVADRLYILTTLIGLAHVGAIPWWLVVVLVGRDALLTLTVPLLARAGSPPLEVVYVGKAATFCLLIGFPMLLGGTIGGIWTDVFRPLGWAFALWGTGLYLWSAAVYLRRVTTILRLARSRPA